MDISLRGKHTPCQAIFSAGGIFLPQRRAAPSLAMATRRALVRFLARVWPPVFPTRRNSSRAALESFICLQGSMRVKTDSRHLVGVGVLLAWHPTGMDVHAAPVQPHPEPFPNISVGHEPRVLNAPFPR